MNRFIRLFQKPRLRLRWKLLGGFLATNILLVIALGIALSNLFGAGATLDTMNRTNKRSEFLADLKVAESQLTAISLDYLWSLYQVRLTDYDAAKQNLDKAFNSFQPSPAQRENYNQLKKEIDSLRNLLEQMISAAQAGSQNSAQSLWQVQGGNQVSKVLTLIDQLDQQEHREADLQYQQTRDSSTLFASLITVLAIVALLAAIFLAFMLTEAVTNPVAELKQRLAELAEGNLSNKLQIPNQDELGELSSTYNTTVSSLQGLVKQLYEQSQHVSLAAEELNSQAHDQVMGSSEQANAITEVSQALQNLNNTAQEIARQTLATTEDVERSLEQAYSVNRVTEEMVAAHEQGHLTIARTVQSIFKLKEQIGQIEHNQQLLVAQSDAIQRVVDLIDSISKETHLLALNAAIEAAGAGAYGSRFAVIAGEVKQLADRSLRATEEVKTFLSGILVAVQEAGKSAVQAAHEAEGAVADAGSSDKVLVYLTELSEGVKIAVQTIVEHIKGTSLRATKIGVATQEQQSANQRILETITSIEAVTNKNLLSIQQGEKITHQLSLSAREMESSANTFRIAS